MKLRESEEKLYLETLERLTKMAQPLGQKHVDYMKHSLDEYFAYRASLHPSEIDGEDLRLRWRSQLRLSFSNFLRILQAKRLIERRNSFKLDA
jgi:hypothetical protein